MKNKYSYQDPNAGNLVRSAEGDSYQVIPLGVCQSGVAIKIFSGSTEVLYSCYQPGTLQTDQSQTKYDCLNGQCVPESQYSTPGNYQTLEECQSSCGGGQSCLLPFKCLDPENYCPTGKVCIPQQQWNQIEGLAGELKSKNCSNRNP
jgi:hypothetical protein